MPTKRILFFVLLISLGCVVPIFPTDQSPAVPNNDFEIIDAQGFPGDWTIAGEGDAGTAPGEGIQIATDTEQPYSGNRSLLISHDRPRQSSVVSGSLTLKVGRLYRLSGWLRTQSAETDPIDRYPTPVAACLTMESFPFTNHSPSLGASAAWQKIETLFIASRSGDRVRLHLGYNGKAKGKAWFDDIRVEEVDDISAYIPMETVKWFGPAFRYTDKGWIFIHIEGKPYPRGYQYGYLLAEEITAYMRKLAYAADHNVSNTGWEQLRQLTNALMLRKYDDEYLEEMKGMADGAVKAGALFENRPIDLLDIVTLNSAVDIGQLARGLPKTPHALSGKSFLSAEDELNVPLREHKCSSFLANGPATKDGGVVFGQLFMWSGYTGVHWNIICDVAPDKGFRLVYETFPGGIHSGSDFYINAAGIMIGETTVSQTPFDMDGTPQSNRIRKAAQYASGIDDVVRILSYKNNGLYTNDWLIGDAKTNEIAIFLLGTKKSKLWRSRSADFPGGTKGFLWSDNNTKDDEVRKEYIAGDNNAPADVIFSPWNRDLAFVEFFKKYNGRIDANVGVDFLASSPTNRPHACDGKLTTTEMAKQMVFMAHFGKVTLREKMPAKENRLMPDSPEAIPHLTLGYSIISPLFVTEKLKALKEQQDKAPRKPAAESAESSKPDISEVKDIYSFDSRTLWHNTVYPASTKENWFVSGTAAYWEILNQLPTDANKAVDLLSDKLAELDCQLLYTISREGALAPLQAQLHYDRYNHYRIPRIRGTVLLHQLRLKLGNQVFAKLMNTVHDRFREKPMTYRDFIAAADSAGSVGENPLAPFILQWLEREELPQPSVTAETAKAGDGWDVSLKVKQPGNNVYQFITTIIIETAKEKKWRKIEVTQEEQVFTFHLQDKPAALFFNAGTDIPVPRKNYYTLANFNDDFDHTLIVYGTARQVEANHTMALQYQTVLADRFSEILPPLRKDSEISSGELESSDLIIMGGVEDNTIMKLMAEKLGLVTGKNFFQWRGKVYGDAADGLMAAYPNPYNPHRTVYFVISNSALQLYHMTKPVQKPPRAPGWGVFKGDQVVDQGYHPVEEFEIRL
ncbi:MAG: C45 family autoproteolytic acyltransferase/hydrolase [Candidatus Aminicenantes bacterium]|nr:C45 family autoproteolytic acyltransferase/hydrolase [Candidatus Aminicenantes bacterium]